MWELGSSPRQRMTKKKNGFLHGVANKLSLLQVHLNKRLYTLFSIKLQNSLSIGEGSDWVHRFVYFFVHATACTCFIFQHLVAINFCKFSSWVWLPDIEIMTITTYFFSFLTPDLQYTNTLNEQSKFEEIITLFNYHSTWIPSEFKQGLHWCIGSPTYLQAEPTCLCIVCRGNEQLGLTPLAKP